MQKAGCEADRVDRFGGEGARIAKSEERRSGRSVTETARLTVFFSPTRQRRSRLGLQKIGQSIPIVAETEQIADRRNSSLNSRAQNSDGSARRFFVGRRKISAAKSACYHGLKQWSGSDPHAPPLWGRGIAYGISRFESCAKAPRWIRKFRADSGSDSQFARNIEIFVQRRSKARRAPFSICDSPALWGRAAAVIGVGVEFIRAARQVRSNQSRCWPGLRLFASAHEP